MAAEAYTQKSLQWHDIIPNNIISAKGIELLYESVDSTYIHH